MTDIVCAGCGGNGGFYREVEVSGESWVDADIWLIEGGDVIGSEGNIPMDISDMTIERFGMWCCSLCQFSANSPEELVRITNEFGEEEPNQIRHYQKNPMPGQIALEIG